MCVSPLIHALGSEDLTDEVKRGCHSALAEQWLQKGALALDDLGIVVTHLVAAHELERAVLFLTWGLSQLQKAIETGDIDVRQAKALGLCRIFWGVSLPDAVSLQTRLLLRSQQLRMAEALSRDRSFVLADLSRLIDAAGEAEATGRVAAAVFAIPVLASIDFDASGRCLTQAVHALPRITLPGEGPLDLPPGLTPGSFLWLNLAGVQTLAHVHRWCDMLAAVPVEVRQQALSDLLSDLGASVLIDRLLLTEASQPAAAQNWERVLAALDEVAAQAETIAAELLVAAVVRAKIVVLCRHLHQPEYAIAIAEAALTPPSDDLRIHFLVCDVIGQQLSYVNGKEAEAALWLQRADSVCALIPQRLAWERATTLLTRARLADKGSETDRAAELLTRAVELVQSLPERSEVEMVRCLGELAIAKWKQGNYQGAFEALDDAAPRLLHARTESAEWRALFILFGHTAGYMAQCARTGHPPPFLEDGDPMILPPVGKFHDVPQEELARRYRPETDIAMPCIMAQFAQSVACDDRVSYWADQTIMMGRQLPVAGSVVATATFSILPHLVVSGQLLEFFDSAREAACFTTATYCLSRRGEGNVPFKELNVEVLLGGRGSEDWNYAEQNVLGLTLTPLAVYLATLSVRAGEHPDAAEQLRQYTEHAMALCRAQMAVLPYCGRYALSEESAYRLLLLPFVEAFWGWAMAHRRVCFSPPVMVEQAFADAAHSPIPGRAQRMMHVVANGLGVRYTRVVDDGFRQWELLE